MVRISVENTDSIIQKVTETLIRKRAEHNDMEISTLEELSLHQQDIERIEHIDKWCRDLRILYLQSNLIPKIVNVGRLKKLQYLNLALNNIEKIENLEGCESLQKLDLTVNFVGMITSVENLKDLVHFEELFLTGNPCTDFEGYREYVIASLPRLQRLDGTVISKSERIQSIQQLPLIKLKMIQQEEGHRKQREMEKNEAEIEKQKQTEKCQGEDGRWYTDINSGNAENHNSSNDAKNKIKSDKKNDDDFWQEKVGFTPESRIAVHEHMAAVKETEKKQKSNGPIPEKRKVRLQTDDGRILNVNEAKVRFSLIDDEEENSIKLEVACYKYLDTSLVDVDVQPHHVTVKIKGKVLQLVLSEEVEPDSSIAQRSQTTGHLVVRMPKVTKILTSKTKKKVTSNKTVNDLSNNLHHSNRSENTFLEVDPSTAKTVNLLMEKNNKTILPKKRNILTAKEKPVSREFEDDFDVPPLM